MDAPTLPSAPHDFGGSSERDDIVTDGFAAGIVIGLLMGGFIGTLAVALVVSSSERFPRARRKRPKT